MDKTFRRNWTAVFIDYVFFGLGLTFAHNSTVLPAFAATLTSSKALIGSVSAVWLGAWLVPQLFAANFLTHKPRKYGYMVKLSAVSRPIFWLFSIMLVLGWFSQWPMVVLVVFLIGLAWFAGADAFVAIAWFDIFGKAMSPRERGRLIGIGQVVDGVLAIGAGWLVAYILSDSGLPYPYDYAAIFGLAGTAFFVSWVAIVAMVELPEPVPEQPPVVSWRDYLPQFVEVWKRDPVFARFIAVRMLASLSELATSFYIIHATQVAHVGGSIVGSLAAVGSIGVALAGVLLGQVAATQGSQRVIQIVCWLSILPPALGLVVSILPVSFVFIWVYIACYLIIGMVNGSGMLGFFNYILDLAPPGYRPIYMGLANTLNGLMVVAPIVGGWILDYSSYPILFALTLAGVTASAWASIGLPPVRHRAESLRQTEAPVVPS
jgi:MFS family permease